MPGKEVGVRFERRGHAGVITLDRPEALNALTLDMIRAMRARLVAWAGEARVRRVLIRGAGEKAFCAGGDIRALYHWGRRRDPTYFSFFREEYLLNTLIKRYPKPYVALLDGITMGGGVGVSVHGSHRLASERLSFAMPETGIGFFPDVGGTYFLPRCPGRTGLYLALTGARLKAADALYCGIATHLVPAQRLGDAFDALCAAEQLDGAIEPFAVAAGPAPLDRHRPAIDRHFAAGSVEAILDSLDAEAGDWSAATAATIRTKSPTSLKLTYRQLAEGVRLEFEDCMRIEYRMASRTFDAHDFFEGIRAQVLDKDLAPAWRPAALEEVSEADVAAYFAPLAEELPAGAALSA
jgi:enoyl-CoA hydratase